MLYLFLNYYKIPDLKARVGGQRGRYNQLVKVLGSDEMKQLRHQAMLQDKNEQEKTLSEIVVEKIGIYGLELNKQTPRKKKSIGDNLEEEGQNIQLLSAGLDPIIRFAASLTEAKNSVRIESFEVRRASRSRTGESEDAWVAELDLVDYRAKE